MTREKTLVEAELKDALSETIESFRAIAAYYSRKADWMEKEADSLIYKRVIDADAGDIIEAMAKSSIEFKVLVFRDEELKNKVSRLSMELLSL